MITRRLFALETLHIMRNIFNGFDFDDFFHVIHYKY